MAGDEPENVIGTYAALTRDFRAVMRGVTDPTTYYSVTADIDGEDATVLYISLYDEDEDGGTEAFSVSSRDLASDTAFHLNAVRFLLVPMVVEVRGIPRYVVEPGPTLVRWVRTRLGVPSYRDYVGAILAGRMGARLGALDGGRRELEEELEALSGKAAALEKRAVRLRDRVEEVSLSRAKHKERARRAERERASAVARASETLGEVGRARDALAVETRRRVAEEEKSRDLEAEIRHLRQLMQAAGVDYRPRQLPVI